MVWRFKQVFVSVPCFCHSSPYCSSCSQTALQFPKDASLFLSFGPFPWSHFSSAGNVLPPDFHLVSTPTFIGSFMSANHWGLLLTAPCKLSISLELCLLHFLIFLRNTNYHPKYSIKCSFILLFYINFLSVKCTRVGTFVCFVHCISSAYDRTWDKLGAHLVFIESWINMICLGINGLSTY